jgi:hypothetical protein
LPNK